MSITFWWNYRINYDDDENDDDDANPKRDSMIVSKKISISFPYEEIYQ